MMKERQDIEFIHVNVELKAQPTGIITGYAGVFGNRDLVGDTLVKGCFAKTLQAWKQRGTLPRYRWRHGDSFGNCLSLSEDDLGLKTEGQAWIDDPDVADFYKSIIEAGAGKIGMSFAFIVTAAQANQHGRIITELELLDDITLSTQPVNKLTMEHFEAKGERSGATKRQAEGILRDAGISRGDAKRLLGNLTQRDAGEELPEILAALQAANAS